MDKFKTVKVRYIDGDHEIFHGACLNTLYLRYALTNHSFIEFEFNNGKSVSALRVDSISAIYIL